MAQIDAVIFLFPFLLTYLLVQHFDSALNQFLAFIIGLNAIIFVLTLVGFSFGEEVSQLGHYVAESEHIWFSFCAYFNFGYFMFMCLFLESIIQGGPFVDNNGRMNAVIILNLIFAVIGFFIQLRAIGAVLSYPIQMANIIENWHEQEGGPKASIIKPTGLDSIYTLRKRLPQYYQHEEKRANGKA